MGPIAEWLARIEHKIDLLLQALLPPMKLSTPMEFNADPCPLCKQTVQYQLHHQLGFVLRRCGCKTGKVPSTIPLIPTGEKDADPHRNRNEPAGRDQDSEDSEGSSAGDTGSRRVRR